MAFLGRMIKTAIDIGHTLKERERSPAEIQREVLLGLMKKARDTAFGKYYHFEGLLRADEPEAAFAEAVPLFDYDRMHEQWWSRQQSVPDITWPGIPSYFALSSGTTGKESKRIPVTDAMLSSIRSVGIDQALALSRFDLPPEFFEKDILMLSSSARLQQNGPFEEGEISGINSSNMPAWFSGHYKPGVEIARIDNWDDRIAAIVKKAPDWDVGAIAGIPSWVRAMLRAIIEEHGLEHIHTLWPNLRVYVSGGVAFEPFRKSFDQLMGQSLQYLDTYLASEGFFAYTARPGTLDMRLAIDHGIYYEFIPFDQRGFDEMGNLLPEPEVLTLTEVRAGEEYALVTNTCAGAWRYLIGDTIRFTDIDRMEMVLAGRTKYFLNVAGSQLSEEKLNAGIGQLAERVGINIPEFAVAALQDEAGTFTHHWVLGMEKGNGVSEKELAKMLDRDLRELNKNYEVARTKALEGVQVKAVPESRIYDWLAQRKKKGGQIKLPRVMKEADMRDLLAFLEGA